MVSLTDKYSSALTIITELDAEATKLDSAIIMDSIDRRHPNLYIAVAVDRRDIFTILVLVTSAAVLMLASVSVAASIVAALAAIVSVAGNVVSESDVGVATIESVTIESAAIVAVAAAAVLAAVGLATVGAVIAAWMNLHAGFDLRFDRDLGASRLASRLPSRASFPNGWRLSLSNRAEREYDCDYDCDFPHHGCLLD